MLNPLQIRRRLGEGAAAAVQGDRLVLDETASWLTSVTARELLRIDHYARQFRYEGPALGKPEKWTRDVLASPLPVVAVLAAMHPDGYVRERAVRSMVTSRDALSDRALAIRVSDHVGVIREVAVREVLRRRTLDHADAPIEHDQRRAIAFAAGLPAPAHPSAAQDRVPAPDCGPVPATSRRSWWRIWNRPSSM